jgi:hypothetical protein
MSDVEADRTHQAARKRDGTGQWPWSGSGRERLAQPVHETGDRPVGFHAGPTHIDGVPIAAHLEPIAKSDE